MKLHWAVAAAGIGLGVMAMLAAPAQAAPQTYTLDPERSFVHFEVVHFGASTSRGRFGPVAGSVVLDPAAGRGEVGLRIATAGVSARIPVFEAGLRSEGFLAVTAHPEAFFVASRLRFDASGLLAELRGEFTLRGIGQPLTLRALRFACRREGARERCGGDFEGELQRSSFGITHSLPFVADRVLLRVQVEGVRDG
jgi:polyisoprenoid-binding protein YceI